MRISLAKMELEVKQEMISEVEFEGQKNKLVGLCTESVERESDYKETVKNYNIKMHQLSSNLPQFLETLKNWDMGKERLFLFINQYFKNDQFFTISKKTENQTVDLPYLLNKMTIETMPEHFKSFQERHKFNDDVLKYIKNFPNFNTEVVSWEDHQVRIKGSLLADDNDPIYLISESLEVTTQDRNILNALLNHFLNNKNQSNLDFNIYSLFYDQIFKKESNNEHFLTNFCRLIKKRSTFFNLEQFNNLRMILRKIIDGFIKSNCR